MGDDHHLFRFTPEFTAFDGWRLAVTVRGLQLVRYFSSLQFGGEQAAHAEARRVRDALFADLERGDSSVAEVFARYLPEVKRLFPIGLTQLRPERGADVAEPVRRVYSMRLSEPMARVCRRLQLLFAMDLSSVLRLALFVFAVEVFCRLAQGEGELAEVGEPGDAFSAVEPGRMDVLARWLSRFVASLDERAASVDLPPFAEFAVENRLRR